MSNSKKSPLFPGRFTITSFAVGRNRARQVFWDQTGCCFWSLHLYFQAARCKIISLML